MPRPTALVLLFAAALPACAKVHAKAPVAVPALLTPAPPARIVVPVALAEPAAPPPATAPTPSAPARPRDTPPRTERPVPPVSPPPVAVAPEPAPSPPVLQMTSNPGEIEQRARTLLTQAQRDLDRINEKQLNPSARTQYDSATGFIRQAQDALKVRNVVLARELADKAASLAAQLRR